MARRPLSNYGTVIAQRVMMPNPPPDKKELLQQKGEDTHDAEHDARAQ